MAYLVWAGVALTVTGFAGIIGTIVAVARARRAGLDDAGLRARLGQILPWNLGAFMISALGLMAVVTGIILG